jgi:metal-responsive CopG/Arc/MetJ family transcriptional regulator
MEESEVMPVSEKIFVRLPKDLATALDRYVEKRARATPGIRLTRSDAVRTFLHRCLQEELDEQVGAGHRSACRRQGYQDDENTLGDL